MAEQIEKIGIVISADGTVELANGMKLTGDQVANLAKRLDEFAASTKRAETGMKPTAAAARELATSASHAGQSLAQAGRDAAQGDWRGVAASLAAASVEANVLRTTALGAGLALGAVLGTAAVAVGAYAVAVAKGALEERALNDQLVLTGNHAGMVAGQLDSMAGKIAARIKGNVSDTKEILTALTASGRFTQESMQEVATASQLMQRFSGQSTAQVTQQWVNLSQGVAKGAAKMNESMHFLTIEQWKHIEALEKTGKAQEAVRFTAEAVTKHLGGDMTRNLGTVEKAIDDVSRAWGRLKNWMLSLGKESATEQLMKDSNTLIGQLQKGWLANTPANQARLAQAKADNFRLLRMGEFERGNVDARSAQQVADAAAIVAAQKEKDAKGRVGGARREDQTAERYMAQLERQLRALSGETSAYADALDYTALHSKRFTGQILDQVLVTAKQIDQQRATQRVNAIEVRQWEELATARERTMDEWLDWQAAQREEIRDREFEISLIGKTTEKIGKLTIAYNAEREARARRSTVFTQLERGDIRPETAKLLLDQIDKFRDRKIELGNQDLADRLKPGWQKMVEGWRDTNQLMVDAYNDTMDHMLRSGEDAFVEWAQTGKFNAKRLVDGMIAEFARLSYRSVMGNLMNNTGGGGGFNWSSLVQMFTSSSGSLSASGGGNVGFSGSTGAMHGGGVVGGRPTFTRDVDPGVFAGAPRFHRGGMVGADEVPIIAKRGEGVFTREQMAALQPAGAATTVTFAPVINIDARTDRAEVEQLVGNAMRASQAELLEKMDRRMA